MALAKQETGTPHAKRVKNALMQVRSDLQSVLPKGKNVDVLIKSIVLAIVNNPSLAECDPKSFVTAAYKAAELGLEFTGSLGQAYLVPFNNTKKGVKEVQFMPGYRGLTALARRSGEIANIEAHVVRDKDEFNYELGTNSQIKHIPALRDRGEMTHVYGVAKLKEPGTDPIFEVMGKAEIDEIKKRSKSRNNGPWITDYIEMSRKTVVRRICKYLPMSTDFSKAIEFDNEIVGNSERQQKVVDVEQSLLNDLGSKAESTEPVDIEIESQEIPDAEPEQEPESNPKKLSKKEQFIFEIENACQNSGEACLETVKLWYREDTENRSLKKSLDKYTVQELESIWTWINTN